MGNTPNTTTTIGPLKSFRWETEADGSRTLTVKTADKAVRFTKCVLTGIDFGNVASEDMSTSTTFECPVWHNLYSNAE